MLDTIHYYGHLFVSDWLDTVWLVITPLIVHKRQRWKALAFMLLCMFVLRLQVEIIQSTGFETGFTGLLDWSLMNRGFVVYGFFSTLYLLLSYFSPFTHSAIYLAASLSIFFMAFTASSIVLII
ncbi:MAG: hypothetical protein H6864_09845 [Micavibrio sp.]|nr:hypothetical protein [Micavibrio sp.]HPQ50407.1 hypothetical protein [Alphaproteobacteria bacterium]